MYLYVNKLIQSTSVEGPGIRDCIYLQGCSIQCIGCIVPKTWEKEAGIKYHIKDIKNMILNNSEIEGVTFSGGEPFDQSKALVKLGNELKKEGLTIVIFSGYTLEYLLSSSNQDHLDLLKLTDLLIDGPFLKDKLDLNRLWVGSSNQRYHFLTDTYKNFKSNISNLKNKVEIRLENNGEVIVNGMVGKKEINQLFKDIK
jgi:anaerobic ribonucleoside-triphosphate reductase activating protein